MGWCTGFHQELVHIAVELHKGHRVPVVDDLDQIGGLALGLVGGVPVQIETVIVAPGVVGAPVRVLIGANDEDDIVQNIVYLQGDIPADGVQLTGIIDAGIVLDLAAGISGKLLRAQTRDAQVYYIRGKQLGDIHATVQETSEGVIGDGLLSSQSPQQVELGIYARVLVRVYVVEEQRHPILTQRAVIQLEHQGGRIGLRNGVHLLECIHRGFAVG